MDKENVGALSHEVPVRNGSARDVCVPEQGYEVLFYGDSITEEWLGTSIGKKWDYADGVPDIFQQYFGSKYRTGVLAIAGLLPCCIAL